VGRVWDVFRPGQAVDYEFFEGRAHGASRLGLVAYYPLVLLAVWGAVLLRRRRAPLLPLLAMPLMVTVTAALVYGLTRFRFAAEPAIVVLAAVSLDALVARLRGEGA
jgi:asparagine N-glycosylation enzyme membrane subunit Stt3